MKYKKLPKYNVNANDLKQRLQEKENKTEANLTLVSMERVSWS